jgi:hypothetical protein
MADTQGQADIKGIDIQKFVTGFADEDSVLKRYCRKSNTSAREIRWFQKTAGYLAPTTTSGITKNFLANTSARSIAPIAQPSWTKNTSYVRKYYVKSEIISMEDEADTDVDVLATTIRDLLLGVASQVDTRIYNVVTENLSVSTITTVAATDDGWDDTATGNPIKDILAMKQKIRAQRYNPEGGILYMNSIEHLNLLNYLISVKGSSIPSFASNKVVEGRVMEILGLNVVVSENATTDYVVLFLPEISVAWKQFMPLTSEVERIPGVGKVVHVWEEGEALLEHPKSVCLLTDTVV